MSIKEKNQHTISIRLHTSNVKDYEDVLKDKYKNNGKSPAIKNIMDPKYGNGYAFSLVKQPSHPLWANDFETLIKNTITIPFSEYSKAVIVLKISTRNKKVRFMSISFGYGDSMLDSSKYENDFGRNIAAQKIPESGVMSAGTIQISDAIIQMEKQYTGTRSSGIQHLLTSQSEFPNGISGTWHNGEIETKLEGRGPLLKAKRLMNLGELVSDLGVYLELYLNPTSKMAEWATRLTKIGTGDLNSKLIEELMSKLISNSIEYGIAWPNYRSVDELSTDLLKDVPNISPAKQITWYIEKQKSKDASYNTTQLRNKIKSSKLQAINDEGQKISVSLYSGFFADMLYNKHRYLLFNNCWYEVSQNFYDDLESKIKSVDEYEVTLPELSIKDAKSKNPYESEGEYNIKLAKYVKDGMLFDKVNFKNNQGGRFRGVEEPADVITNNKELFFVKKGGASATLSHLFLQGLVSAKLLAKDGDGKFREFINDNLDSEKDVFTSDVSNSAVTIIFVIITNSNHLPFFSMISFSEVLANLREMGYNVKIAWTSME